MIPQTCPDDESLENDVRYGIDDCRRRLRSQRATLRAQHHFPIDVSNGTTASEAPPESYAEVLANISLSHGSLARLVECLLGPSESSAVESVLEAAQEEAAIT